MSNNSAKQPDWNEEQFWLILVFAAIIALLMGLTAYQAHEIALMPKPCISIPDARQAR